MLQSRNYAPGPALEPYIRRHYVFEADLPAQFELTDCLLNEFAFIRVLVRGDWEALDAAGQWARFQSPVFSGANSGPFKVRVRGPFCVVGCSLRPSAWHALWSEPADQFADRMVSLADYWGAPATQLHADILGLHDDAAIIAAVETMLMARIIAQGRGRPDAALRRFEDSVQTVATLRVDEAADIVGLSVRQFERQCKAAFGHSPKTVLRRARFLDMATALRGFADPAADEATAMRFADQSHRNREFRRFIGMTPGQFERSATPLFTAGLKLRAEGLT